MPPNIHDIENFTLLRQALDILEAPEPVQQGLYPADRDPAEEMSTLFRDAWSRIDAAFRPVLSRELCATLESLDAVLGRSPVDWQEVRALARRAGDLQPSPPRSRPARTWLDQLVRGPHHLLLRSQTLEPGASAPDAS